MHVAQEYLQLLITIAVRDDNGHLGISTASLGWYEHVHAPFRRTGHDQYTLLYHNRYHYHHHYCHHVITTITVTTVYTFISNVIMINITIIKSSPITSSSQLSSAHHHQYHRDYHQYHRHHHYHNQSQDHENHRQYQRHHNYRHRIIIINIIITIINIIIIAIIESSPKIIIANTTAIIHTLLIAWHVFGLEAPPFSTQFDTFHDFTISSMFGTVWSTVRRPTIREGKPVNTSEHGKTSNYKIFTNSPSKADLVCAEGTVKFEEKFRS